jgi:hypothetical protein
MPNMPDARQIRAGLMDSVQLDLLGPVEEDELLFDYRVRDRYMVGMLATDGTQTSATGHVHGDEPDIDKPAAEAHDAVDHEPAKAMLFPSSLGMSFAVEPGVASIRATATWGEYRRVDNPTPVGERPQWQEDDKFNRCWQRTPRTADAVIALIDGHLAPEDFPAAFGTVRLAGICRATTSGFWLVTLFLHNRQQLPSANPDEAWLFQPRLEISSVDGATVFAGRAEAVEPEPSSSAGNPDASERARLDMAYRRRVEFARGHAVSVIARPSPDDPTRTDRIATTYLPIQEIRSTAPASPANTAHLAGLVTDMGRLGALPADELQKALSPLADGYANWLQEQAATLDTDPTLAGHREPAEDALYEADLVAQAIREGVSLLVDGSDALAAFRFANTSMAEQRLRTDAIRARRDGDERDLVAILDEYRSQTDATGENPHTRWRPFQLAFILLNLAALADPTHDVRSSDSAAVDLLFFPTGGGKTEAYLGLVAATFALRRLQSDLGDVDGSDGVAVLMRYTLRLLTAQQFERAAALVCATEHIRRSDEDRWGNVPFRLGMWVGGSLTPNRSKEAGDALDKLRKNQRPYGGSPHQLAECPWCGQRLDPTATPRHVIGPDDPDPTGLNPGKRFLTYCPDEGCEFGKVLAKGEGIPVVTVDEDIYRLLPTFVIGTIDKFAQLPWNPNVRMLFGRVNDRCPDHGWRGPDATYWPDCCGSPTGHTRVKVVSAPAVIAGDSARLRPPDLIIQDEFHLITGPLGTLAGLYETAVDELSTWRLGTTTVRPKIVASTATIRRAAQQTRAVFARQTRIFPPQVLDVDNTFFARELPLGPDDPLALRYPELEHSAGRLYMGVAASGRRLKEAESRLFRTVMAAAQYQWDEAAPHVAPGQVNPADPWMTTVGYFSAIRELAGMYRIATDELQNRLRGIERDRRGFLAPRFASEFDMPDGTRKRMWWQPEIVELTSRVGAADLRDVLGELFEPHNFSVEASQKAKSGFRLEHRGIDLVLATNMISVGVDVSRLGMMVVVGQPKTTAEYIQASSRVGRDFDKAPGVVFTLSNWARPRDLSHWEQFEHYHDTFYRNVEAQSVTPFAPRALDRGATGVLVSLLRGGVDDWAEDRGVIRISAADPRLDAAVETLRQRAEHAKATKDQIEAAQAAGKHRADDLVAKLTNGTTTYAWRSQGAGSKKEGLTTLLHGAEDANGQHPWIMPNSLRNTEPGINVLIDRQANPPDEPEWDFSSVGSGAGAAAGSAVAPTVDDDVDDLVAADYADALATESNEEA